MKQRTILSLPTKATVATAIAEVTDMVKLDAAIWEIMSDYRKRTIYELLDAMVVRGYPRNVVDRRMDVLFAKKWFDRNGERGNDVKYVLKKHIKNPLPENQGMEKKASEISVGLVEVLAAATPVLPVRNLGDFKVDKNVVDDMCHGALSMPNMDQPAAPQYVVEPTDHVRLAIWKVTQDRQTYTVTDLATLLDHIPVGTINYHLRTMAVSMFDVTKVEGSKAYAYTMREGVPMPEGLPAYQPNVAAEVKPEEKPAVPQPVEEPAAAAQQPEISQDKDIAMTTTPPTEAPLFSMTTTIRGKEFTLDELRNIKEDLMACGFIKSNRSSHHSVFSGDAAKTIEFQVKIKGMDFTLPEVRELAAALAKI